MALIDVALLLCPREFRREFREQIHSNGGDHPTAALDIAWTGLSMHAENFARNMKTTVRAMVKSPVSTVVIVATLAAAIGANVAVFTAFSAALLQPLPFPGADRLVRVSAADQTGEQLYTPRMKNLIGPDVHSFAEVAAVTEQPGAIVSSDSTYEADRGIATQNFFSFLGAKPELGRLLQPSDDGGEAAVISDSLWRTHFGSDPNVIGQHLRFTPANASDSMDFIVVGVAGPAMELLRYGDVDHPDFWSTARTAAERFGAQAPRGTIPLVTDTLGKLGEGVTAEAAANDVQRVVNQLFPPGSPMLRLAKVVRAVVTPLNSDTLAKARYLWTLFAAVLAVLLVACLNVANLLLTRAASRTQELALRSALGASRGHIVTLLVYESTLFALLGAGFGAWLGITGFSGILALSPTIAKIPNVHADGRVFAFTAVLMALVALSIGLLPALLQRGRREATVVHAGTRGGTFAAPRLRFALGVAEIGIAFPLLVGAGLLVHSFFLVANVSHGFSMRNLYEADYNLPVARYGAFGAVRNAVDELTQRIRSIPGVLSVGYANHGLSAAVINGQYFIKPGGSPIQDPNVIAVTPDFFDTLGLKLSTGKNFTANASGAQSSQVIVDRRVAQLLDSGDPLGQHIYAQDLSGDLQPLSIIGVADTIDNTQLGDQRVIYTPAFSDTTEVQREFCLYVRTNGQVPDLSEQISKITSSFDPLIVSPTVRPVADVLAVKDASWRAGMILLSCLAVAALFLALVGIYGVTSYAVQARTRELGIRMAIGATPRTILALVLRTQLMQGLLGLAIGVVLSLIVTQTLSSQLYAITALDPVAYLVVATLLLSTGLLAALLPGIRAMQIHPAIALRYE